VKDHMVERSERRKVWDGLGELISSLWLNIIVITFVIVMITRSVSTPVSQWASRAVDLLIGK